MFSKKTRIDSQDIEITNAYDFKQSPRISSMDLMWNMSISESSAALCLMFMIPDQKIVAKGTIDNEDGDVEDVYYNIELSAEKETEADLGTKLFPSDIFPKQVEIKIQSLEKVDDYTYNIKLDSIKVSF